jgi:GAF domain-containing protein
MARSENPQPASAAEALERLGRLPLREQSMESLLQTVADLAKTVMPGNPETSVSLLIDDRPTTVVYSGQLAIDLDESQYGIGYGPCLHTGSTGEAAEIADARVEPRWRGYLQRAVELGCLSSLAVPLPVSEGVSGALNVYARQPNAFDEDSRSIATRFASYAGVVAGNLRAYQSARDEADNLQVALESRAVIDQAKGILMERLKLTADAAFQLLARTSMHTNTRVYDIADHLVRTGELPAP